jgi:MFS family permease
VVLVGVAISPGFASSMALLSSHAPITGALQGTISAFSGAGCMVQPLLVSLLAKHTSLSFQGLMWMSLVSFGLMIAMLLLEACCVPRGRRRAVLGEADGLVEPLLDGPQQQQQQAC